MVLDVGALVADRDHGTLVVTLLLLLGIGLALVVSGLVRLRAARHLRSEGIHTEADVVAARSRASIPPTSVAMCSRPWLTAPASTPTPWMT